MHGAVALASLNFPCVSLLVCDCHCDAGAVWLRACMCFMPACPHSFLLFDVMDGFELCAFKL